VWLNDIYGYYYIGLHVCDIICLINNYINDLLCESSSITTFRECLNMNFYIICEVL